MNARYAMDGGYGIDYSEDAWKFYNGGWRTEDAEQLRLEYDLDDEEPEALVAELTECARIAK